MNRVVELADRITQLDAVEREELIHLIEPGHSDASPSEVVERLKTPAIVSTPGICGGVARIIRTRIPVWTLERMRQLGVSEADILHSYPSLKAVDLVQAWAYAECHPQEIDRQIRENEE